MKVFASSWSSGQTLYDVTEQSGERGVADIAFADGDVQLGPPRDRVSRYVGLDRMKRRRTRWIVFASLAAILLVVLGGWPRFSTQRLGPWQFLVQVEQVEQSGVDQTSVQPLGWSLAILGRDDEVRQLDFHPQFELPPSTVDAEQLELTVVPWKEGIADIAANHRIVMIMEDHFSSKHREFVGATLSAFKDAGFTHYAVEAIGRFDTSLAQRGYPTSRTGFYTSDPQFGNALRRALELNLTTLGYDFRASTPAGREEFAATELARLFRNDTETKLLVHAGHAHVLKHETEYGEHWLASRLWDKTGIEPFTIWQWSSNHDAHDYEAIVRVLKARGVRFDEPLLLMPPPSIGCGLQDAPYGLARVDAMVLHPPDQSVAPAKRTVLFPDAMQQVAGRWTATKWPVVVSAYRHGEPINAIPLDQVMLRQDEADFVLWIPDGVEYEIRVFDCNGLLNSRVDPDAGCISVGL